MSRRRKRRYGYRQNGVAWQNKDIIAKIFGERLREKSLEVWGIHVPRVAGLEPTNMPSVEVTELRADNVYLLEDGSYAIIDYESKYLADKKIKYIGYILRTVKALREAGMDFADIKIRMIVIYTADVKKGTTEAMLDLNGLELYIDEAFLSDWNSEEVLADLTTKVEKRRKLSSEDQMRFIVLPLTYQGKKNKKKMAKHVIELAKKIKDEEQQRFVLSGIVSFADKVVDREDAEEVRRYLTMTKVGKIIYEEKLAYGKEVEAEVRKKDLEITVQSLISLCKKMQGTAGDVVDNLVKDFGLSRKDAEAKVKALW